MGVIVETKEGVVNIIIYQNRWDNTRACIFWIVESINNPRGFDRALLDRNRFLKIYIRLTCLSLVSYVKGIYFALDSWRDNRDADGWKVLASNNYNMHKDIDMVYDQENREDMEVDGMKESWKGSRITSRT